MILLLSNSLVLVGILILLGSLFTVRRIIQSLPEGRSRKSWFAMASLITLFVIGYLGYVGIFWAKHEAAIDLIVPCVFFFGACFVWLSTFLSLQTAMDIMRISRLEKESFTDPLTGVYNRRYMEQRLQEEIAKARRYKFDLSLLLIDLDHFKLINDKHGHQAGDKVLVDMSALVVHELRDTDILARYGGEEFLAIVPNTSPADASSLAERLRKRIEGHSFAVVPVADEPAHIRLTVSIGVSSYGGSFTSRESLIQTADNNLYLAKDQGRNRVVADGPD
ncbi:MAG: GGDEF domain-containing protein [Gammaproteobacteria bacterium]|nr:GGDEF domain-containing protein [Gammaproteobacteria bacterium]